MRRSTSSRAVDRGLSRIEPEGGVLVVYAAEAGKVAEDGQGEHSPFTLAFASQSGQSLAPTGYATIGLIAVIAVMWVASRRA
jgi:hypothetical protein